MSADDLTVDESTLRHTAALTGITNLRRRLEDLARYERAGVVATTELSRAWAEPPKHLPLAPGPRARGKAQWKRERFTR